MSIYASSLVFTAVGAVFAANLLGAAEYGRFNTAGAYITIAAAFASAGHGERAMRAGARPGDDTSTSVERAHEVGRRFAAQLPLILAVTLPLGLLGQVPVWVTLLICVPTAAGLAAVYVLEAFTRGAFRRLFDLVPFHVLNPVLFTVGCGALLVLDADADSVGLLLFRLALVAGIVAYFVHRLGLRPGRRGGGDAGLEPIGGFTMASALFIVQGQISIIVAGLISAEAAGVYTAAFRAATPVAAAMVALSFLTGPAVATAAQAGRLHDAVPLVHRYSRIGVALALVPALILLVWPMFVLGLFGGEFEGATDALRVLAVTQLVLTALGPATMFATMAGIERVVAACMAGAVVIQLALSLALLTSDELTVLRLAVIDSAGSLTWAVALWWACRRRLGASAAALGR